MKVLFSFSQKGDSAVNEDVCGFTKDVAWVVDGATDVFKLNTLGKENEVYWYVNELQNKFKKIFNSETSNLIDGIQKSVKELYQELMTVPGLAEIPIYKLPTYTVAAIKINADNIMEYYILGDSSIAYIHDGKHYLLEDTRVSKFSLLNRKKLKEYYAGPKKVNSPLRIFQKTRAKANAKNGYPIGTINGEGLSSGLTGKISLSKGDKVIIFSDGFKDYFSENREAINKFFTADLISAEIDKMYDFLNNIDKFQNNPRPKKIDDASLLLMEI